WREDLLRKLLSPSRASRLVAAFGQDAELGVLAPEGHVQPLAGFWGGNEENVRRLATHIGLPPPDAGTAKFVAGSMFYIRLEALRPLLDAHLDPQLFETEQGQIDGTCAHALERLFAHSALAAGFRLETTAA